MIQIKNKVYKLKKAAEVAKNMSLPAGQEIEIVMDVVYINGNMVPPNIQDMFYNWVTKNPDLFDNITKIW
jgi:hypothetical protein